MTPVSQRQRLIIGAYMSRSKRLITVCLTALLMAACGAPETSQQTKPIVILVSDLAKKPIQLAAQDLKADISKVLNQPIAIATLSPSDTPPEASHYFVVGQAQNIAKFSFLNAQQNLFSNLPAERGGIIHQISHKTPTILLTGKDVQGTQYMVYDYSEQVLGVDKLTYWTGIEPESINLAQLTQFKNQRVEAPYVPILGYFENDVDELMNLKKPHLEYDWETFTQMIDSLVRLRYNAIEIFDMLGRVEFYTRPEYIEMHPNYQLDLAKLDKMIDYIHDKGMQVQVDMMMGRQFIELSDEAATCWTDNKQLWIDNWHYYLTDTPVKKTDIFALRPRNQVWDRKYESTCGEDKEVVFNQVYQEFSKVLAQYKPDATKVCVCYDDGMQMFNNKFQPPKDYIIAWSDHGFGHFKYYPDPEKTDGYKMGTYMHAGYWLNHDVADPYPEVVEQTMNQMYKQYDAKHYMLVNGQTFRPFLLNIEAFAQSARQGTDFNGQAFYLNWTSRYFGQQNAAKIVEVLKHLHNASHDRTGYVEILWQIKKMTAYLSNSPLLHPIKPPKSVDFVGVTEFFNDSQDRVAELSDALSKIEQVKNAQLKNPDFFYDHVELPINMFYDLLKFNQSLIALSQLKGKIEQSSDLQQQKKLKEQAQQILEHAKTQLQNIYARRLSGDKHPRWASWYDPAKRRPNNGFPSDDSLATIETALQTNWKSQTNH